MQPLINALILTAHLIMVSVASGAPIAVCWTIWRPKGSFELSISGPILKMACWCLMVGALFGVGYGTLVWDGVFSKSLEVTGSRVTYGIIEFFFSLAIFGAIWYRVDRKSYAPGKTERIAFSILLFAAATNLLYHFPVYFGVIAQLKTEVHDASDVLSSSDFREIAFSSGVLLSALHFLMAIFIISLHSVIYVALNRENRDSVSPWTIRSFIAISAFLVISQVASGLAAYGVMPELQQLAITTHDWEATTVFLLAIGAVLVLPVFQITQWQQPTNFQNARWMLIWTGIVFWLMTMTSELAKNADV